MRSRNQAEQRGLWRWKEGGRKPCAAFPPSTVTEVRELSGGYRTQATSPGIPTAFSTCDLASASQCPYLEGIK